MRPDGAHVHGHGGAELAGALAVLAAVGALIEWLLSVIWILAGIFAVAVAGLLYVGVRMHQKYGRAPEVLPWQQRQALPARQATPIAARTVRALPAPQIQINNFYGLSAEQAAEAVARQRAITGRKD
jgi:hypothetical protein